MEENNILEKARPYFHKADGDTLAILIHGFTGTPYDLRELGEFLYSKNVSVRAPLLPGHGSHWRDLEKVSDKDWQEAIEREVLNFFNEFKNIYLIGYSFGANLALNMSVKHPEKIKGVVSLGISIFLRKDPLIRKMLPVVHNLFGKYRKKYVRKKVLEEYEETGAYARIPTKSIYDFYNFVDNITKKELPKVTVPTLIIHSRDDRVTHPKSSHFVHEKIRSPQKDLLILDDINHNPLNSQVRNEIFSKIERFINSA